MNRLYEVDVTIGDKRRVVVEAGSSAEAEKKVREGKYKRLGRSLERGFLHVGKPEPVSR
jgi:hypothetical protein